MSTHLRLRRLRKRYRASGPDAVTALNLEVEAGERVALLGPSGCGKTTILKMIAGLLAPTGGDVLFHDVRVNDVPAERRGAVMVFQRPLLFPHMTVRDNIGFGLRMQGVSRREAGERVTRMIRLVKLDDLEEDRRPSEISGGQRQRVSLARALVVEPRLLLLDEPLSSLDAHLREEMRALIRTVHRQLGLTTVVVTHDQQEAVVLADRIALLFEGKLQQYAPPRAFYEHPASPRVAAFFGNANRITGTTRGHAVQTSFGTLELSSPPQRQGKVELTIQPEAVRLLTAPDGRPNCVAATLVERLYAGTHWRYRVALDGEGVLEAVASAEQALPGEGERLYVGLPPERLWVFPESG